MPGFWGRENHIVGTPIAPKPARSGPCGGCGVECYREVFVPGTGWVWRHYGCDPVKPVIERRFKRGHITMSYVPKEYGNANVEGRTTQFDPSLAQAIKRNRG